MVRRQDVEAYLSRPWGLFEALRAERQRDLPADESFVLAQRLMRAVRRMTDDETRALARALDWQAHVRLKALLERAGATRRRSPAR